jgi:hypothetical protein
LQVPEIKGEKVELTEDKLSFTGSANGKNYHVDLEFYAPVTVEVNINVAILKIFFLRHQIQPFFSSTALLLQLLIVNIKN